MNKNLRALVLLSLVISVVAIGLSVVALKGKEKTAFVNLQEALNSFEYKKELEAEYGNLESARKMVLDSLKLSIESFYEQTLSKPKITEEDERKLQLMQQQYKMKEKQLAQDNASLSQQYTDQVIKQFNQYVMDYGKKHNYKYIYGANNSGTLMYADDSDNITKDVVEYINKRYNGKEE